MRALTSLQSTCLFFLDPTDSSVKCLSLDYHWGSHILTMQIQPTGTVSRISLIMCDASYFPPSSDDLPSAQSTAAPIALHSMLTRLDQLCEPLRDTLREVVIAIFPWSKADFETLQADPVNLMRGLRDQMPSMARRQRLVFRMSRKSRSEYCGYFTDESETARRHVFTRDSPHWRNIALDN